MIKQYGARAHDFGKIETDQLIAQLIENNIDGVQLASLDRTICECVATESFTLNGDGKPRVNDHNEIGYKAFLKEILEIVEYVEERDVNFAVEPAHHHIIYDIKTTQRLIKDVASPRLKLIFAPCNLMTPEIAVHQEQFLDAFLT